MLQHIFKILSQFYNARIIFTDLAVVTHTHLELNVDFTEKVLEGKAILDIERISSATELVSKIFSRFLLEIKKNFIYIHCVANT